MPTEILKQQITVQGLGPGFVVGDATGMFVTNAAGTILHIRNNGTAPCQIQITPPGADDDGLMLRTLTSTVPAGAERLHLVRRRMLDSSGVLTLDVSGTQLAQSQFAVYTVAP